MRKRGAHFRNRAKSVPGMVAQAVNPEYEIRLRNAVNAIRDGWAGVQQFNDLAETIDLLQIALARYPKQKADPGAEAAVVIAREALYSIRDRYFKHSKFRATGEELKAITLLADTSLDYWNRRSGALFSFAYQQLKELRAEQAQQEEQERKAA